eukprot:4409498-Heterocapsa_arctica.AAC.1
MELERYVAARSPQRASDSRDQVVLVPQAGKSFKVDVVGVVDLRAAVQDLVDLQGEVAPPVVG